jgi:methylene-fatty-acyl-phospholipid synthase
MSSSALSTGDQLTLFAKISDSVTSKSDSSGHMVVKIDASSSTDQITLLLLGLPYIYYTILWYFPQIWVALIGANHPSETMASVAHALKGVQAYALYTLCKDHFLMPSQWIEELGQTVVICSVFLFVLGQYLNYSVYNALGTNGVYYGIRFGIDIPWCYDFPFNISWLKHPQYVGSILSVVAAVPLMQIPLSW